MRSGPGHLPVFACSVELAGMNFAGEPAKTKKQAEKNAAMAAWSTLKQSKFLFYFYSFVMWMYKDLIFPMVSEHDLVSVQWQTWVLQPRQTKSLRAAKNRSR